MKAAGTRQPHVFASCYRSEFLRTNLKQVNVNSGVRDSMHGGMKGVIPCQRKVEGQRKLAIPTIEELNHILGVQELSQSVLFLCFWKHTLQAATS